MNFKLIGYKILKGAISGAAGVLSTSAILSAFTGSVSPKVGLMALGAGAIGAALHGAANAIEQYLSGATVQK